MEPLRKFFPRLKDSEIIALSDFVKFGKNPISCTVCEGIIFVGQTCSTCPFKGRNVRDVLIESYIPMVIDIAGKIARYNRKECISVGLLALTEAINRIPKDIRVLNSYIRTCVTGQIKMFLVEDATIKIPRNNPNPYKFLRRMYDLGDAAVSGGQAVIDLNEILNKIPQTQTEEIIMRCITEGGYSLQDITEMCDLEQSRISQIRQSLFGRIDTALRK